MIMHPAETPCGDSQQEAESHRQSMQEAIFHAQKSQQEARYHRQSGLMPNKMDSLSRK